MLLKRRWIACLLLSTFSLPAGLTFAAQPATAGTQAKKQETVYGSQLMTRKERAEFQAKMRAAKTAEEREKIRAEHHELMKQRAKERGVTLPETPPARGHMMGPGGGMGPAGGPSQ